MGLFDFFKSKPKTKELINAANGFPQYTGSGVCDVCNRPLSGVTAYIVPNNIFYRSKAWRAYFKRINPMITDVEIEQMRNMDNSQGSAVCENCIKMFNK